MTAGHGLRELNRRDARPCLNVGAWGICGAVSLEGVTQLLRRGDAGLVEADLVELLVTGEEEWLKDDRDLMAALAPHHDCARRLGADVAALFRRAAAAGPASMRALVEEFGRRTDVTPQAFGFCVEETSEGLRYRWAESSAVDVIAQLRRAGMVDDKQLERLRRAAPGWV